MVSTEEFDVADQDGSELHYYLKKVEVQIPPVLIFRSSLTHSPQLATPLSPTSGLPTPLRLSTLCHTTGPVR
jgi:hypothetical protein